MSDSKTLSKSHSIRVLNDNFRSTFVGGQVVTTAGVAELAVDTKARLLLAVHSFSEFTSDNDPHGEHDSGQLARRRNVPGKSTTTTSMSLRLGRSSRSGADDARAHHYARR